MDKRFETSQENPINITFYIFVMRISSQRIIVSAAATFIAFAMIAIAPSVVFADSPHFITAFSGLSGPNLVCNFKEAGLGNLGFSSIRETCSAVATAVYECVNGGGNHPQATNKETVSGPVSGGGFFPISNGQTTGMITVTPPSPGSFSCPGGQTLLLASVVYTNVMICDQLGNCVPLASQAFRNPIAP